MQSRSKYLVDVIIATWNNPEQLEGCLRSILNTVIAEGLAKTYVVNNGTKESVAYLKETYKSVKFLEPGKNLGWEGGLKYALSRSNSPYVLFLNDDTHFFSSNYLWLYQMLDRFAIDEVGAVGPSSNVVMGSQNAFLTMPSRVFPVKFLIGFCMLVKREALEKAGGVDDTLPGGDDLDLSIRLRQEGYTLLCDRTAFVYHHGFQTGERVHGNDWNSVEMKERTDKALIQKHGFKEWYELWTPFDTSLQTMSSTDSEGDLIRAEIEEGTILELGCGAKKTVEQAVGVDIVPKGQPIFSLNQGETEISIADINADVSQKLPISEKYNYIIARHVLEHLIDPIKSIKHWTEALKEGGKLIIAVPDQDISHSLPMNIEHVHGFNKESLKSLGEAVGLKVEKVIDSNNGVSIIGVFVKEEK